MSAVCVGGVVVCRCCSAGVLAVMKGVVCLFVCCSRTNCLRVFGVRCALCRRVRGLWPLRRRRVRRPYQRVGGREHVNAELERVWR